MPLPLPRPPVAPLVSIVVATNRPPSHLLRSALLSALSQDWPAVELLVSDDSPDDRLQAQVARLRDPRLRYRHNPTAMGPIGNLRAAMDWARGEYIAFLGQDDWLDPTFVSTLAGPLLADPQVGLAFCDHWVIDGAGRPLAAETELESEGESRDRLPAGRQHDVPLLVVQQSVPVTVGTLFRRTAMPAAWPADAGLATELWLSYLLTQGGGVWFEPRRLCARRLREADSALTALTPGSPDPARLRGVARFWEVVAEDERFASVHDVARARAADADFACAMHSWAGGSGVEARRFAARSLRLRLGWRGLAAWLASALPARLAPRRWRHGPLRLGAETGGDLRA